MTHLSSVNSKLVMRCSVLCRALRCIIPCRVLLPPLSHAPLRPHPLPPKSPPCLIQVLIHDPPVPPKRVNLLKQPTLDVGVPRNTVDAEAEGVGRGLIACEDEGVALSHNLQDKQATGGEEGRAGREVS